jgi:polysaccharide pyruvyl transferase WcaK-like protein
MTSSGRIKVIGVLGHVGNMNLGDEALIAAVIQNVQRHYPDAEIRGFTIHPEDMHQRHKILAFPIRERPSRGSQGTSRTVASLKASVRKAPLFHALLSAVSKALHLLYESLAELWCLHRSYRNIKGTDLLIVAGSQQLSDYFSGPWGNPYNLFRWSLLARLAGTKMAFLSVGAGPLRSALSRFFIRSALARASYRSYRDEGSQKLVKEIGVNGENPIFPDLVYGLEIPTPVASARRQPRLTVGINPFPYFDVRYWPEWDSAVYQRYVRSLAAFAQWLAQSGYTVLFFPTQLRADPPVIRDIRLLMNDNVGSTSAQSVDLSVASFSDLISQISAMDLVVATRFHAVIVSHLLNRPVLAIAYHKKVQEIMAGVGVSEYTVDIDDLNLDTLKARFRSLESKRGVIEKQIARRLPSLHQALEQQYDRVFRLLEKGS